jgi:hypothetical protein
MLSVRPRLPPLRDAPEKDALALPVKREKGGWISAPLARYFSFSLLLMLQSSNKAVV